MPNKTQEYLNLAQQTAKELTRYWENWTDYLTTASRLYKYSYALNISADELLCDLVPSASHVTDDEISKRLEGLTPMQKKVALDLLDTYITNLPYLTKEE